MNAVESPYVTTSSYLSECKGSLKFRSEEVYRFAKKTCRAAVDESEATRNHLKARDLLENQRRSDDKGIVSVQQDHIKKRRSSVCRESVSVRIT